MAAIEAVRRLQKTLDGAGDPAKGEATDSYKSRDDVAYTLSRLPLGLRRPLKIICAGAGFSGLALAREVETKRLQNVSLTVYEKNASVGGTWYENRYPGCACGESKILPGAASFAANPGHPSLMSDRYPDPQLSILLGSIPVFPVVLCGTRRYPRLHRKCS